ncbi:bifunctional diaminohydroxyphosphoribosylaminopyrimidine deaminase/5-amino-6-(5-phosphoribosylamino)uracil reductase RibD [Kaustia mangrovi]|uniref:Riboflavin biosynthesis protein RibD n=1 Tax=Kaustia mangrovi TaxID=2593653 RepID=A0A7S8HDK6_9HYPH|nr:bifunctional diaminohydroxyphosphoribosylaminopyrimidine deaminase/5-amino-6-(5-phosphoribosylamino)uracil reductase RibD [Kaustia mangrovi]QPC44907.1 bifunctional diaminohydroxyphosphoribosylaminopyrimidine deaminase/5-amino-6-(5-phosphoribosylamino)uracil reductase RibD [Kaustia mangrovi]
MGPPADDAGPGGADRRHMGHALRLGERNLGATGDNPAVGCVIVAERRGASLVVGRGWTAEGGRPHAERIALERAGDAARGATAYVTLEPCAHHGKTPPCADALVEAGVARVVSAMEDPDPRVAGRGHAILRAAGIAVEVGLLGDAARRSHAGFVSRITRARPHVLVKLAVSADGKIAAREGEATAITGEAARARTHLMRARSDAIMVGRRTAEIDDPLLTCRLPGLEHRSPVRVVMAANAGLDPASRLVRSARDVALWVAVADDAPGAACSALSGAGAEIVPCPRDEKGALSLPAVLTALADRGIGRLMVEGGAALAGAVVAQGFADEVALFTAPASLGPDGVDALGGVALETVTASQDFALLEEERYGEDRLALYGRQ